MSGWVKYMLRDDTGWIKGHGFCDPKHLDIKSVNGLVAVVVPDGENYDSDTHWIDPTDDSFKTAIDFNLVITGSGSVQDPLMVAGVPDGARVRWPDELQFTDQINDGEITFSASEPGEYKLAIVLTGYKKKVITCQVA